MRRGRRSGILKTLNPQFSADRLTVKEGIYALIHKAKSYLVSSLGANIFPTAHLQQQKTKLGALFEYYANSLETLLTVKVDF